MSDAPAAPVTENGVPPATQEQTVEETLGFKVPSTFHRPMTLTSSSSFSQVFAGNLAYSTTDEGLKAFFAPVENDMYATRLHIRTITLLIMLLTHPMPFPTFLSISAQVIMRGSRSAGYGFVALNSAEAAQKAVDALDKNELDGRPIIVEVAKPADQKDKERKEKKGRRRPGRRGLKAVPGEVTEAEANGEADKAEGTALAANEAEKPKKKKKKAPVSFCRLWLCADWLTLLYA